LFELRDREEKRERLTKWIPSLLTAHEIKRNEVFYTVSSIKRRWEELQRSKSCCCSMKNRERGASKRVFGRNSRKLVKRIVKEVALLLYTHRWLGFSLVDLI
jgi:hypothetical protein